MDHDERAIALGWKSEKPLEEGMYLYRSFREWPHRLLVVKPGDWRLSQDPSSLYTYVSGKSTRVESVDDGWWFGPLHPSPESNWPIKAKNND